jgi:nucleolar protein 56
MMPSSKIQLLGAEKALFRHLKTGAKPPRYGHLFAHPLVQGADDADRGKVARGIADKLALAARADYFGDKYIGDDLRDELEERFT